MTARVVVLGAGYAGTRAVQRLQAENDERVHLTWVDARPYHLVLHEVHRAIRTPDVRSHLTIPIETIADHSTRFLQDRVVGVDVSQRRVKLAAGDSVEYDYLVVAMGSQTAFYGIPGLEEHAYTLKGLSDALGIHDALAESVSQATTTDPAQVIVGGAGLTGIQTAGEIAVYRDEHRVPLEIHVVEALDSVLPGTDPAIQDALRQRLERANVRIHTDDPIVEVENGTVHFDTATPRSYDVLVWTGGITGQEAIEGSSLENRHNRVVTEPSFATSDERVFAVGDSAIVESDGTDVPPTAQAAWQAGSVAADNVLHAIRGQPLRTFTYDDKGTVVSVGEAAVAHDVKGIPIGTFGGRPAASLKKFIAARWIASLTSWRRARRAWSYL